MFQKKKKEMTKRIKRNEEAREKNYQNLIRNLIGDQELVTKYLNAESNGHVVMFLFGLVTIVNHYFFKVLF